MKEAEKEIKISPRKLKRVRKALAEIQALKKELSWKEEESSNVQKQKDFGGI